jgi:predicted transcriptional regulator
MTAELPRIPDELAQSPASDKVVWNALYDADGPLTAAAIAEATHTPRSTVYESLARLVEDDLVEEAPASDSPCQWAYRCV